MTFLQIMGLLGPVLILLAALAIYGLTRWQDEHEARKRAAERAGGARALQGVALSARAFDTEMERRKAA